MINKIKLIAFSFIILFSLTACLQVRGNTDSNTITVGSQQINIPAISEFINVMPFGYKDHKELAPITTGIVSFVLKTDKDKFTKGELTKFDYQMNLDYSSLENRNISIKQFKHMAYLMFDEALMASHNPPEIFHIKKVVDKQNAVGYLMKQRLETGTTMINAMVLILIEGKVLIMSLAKADTSDETIKLVDTDVQTWVDLILKVNK